MSSKPKNLDTFDFRQSFSRNSTQVILLVALALFFSLPSVIDYTQKPAIPQIGDISQEDVIAPMQFEVHKSEAMLETERNAILKSVPIVVVFRHEVGDSVIENFTRTTGSVSRLVRETKTSKVEKIEKVRQLLPQLSSLDAEMLLSLKDFDDFARIVKAALRQVYIDGFVDDDPMHENIPPRLFRVEKAASRDIIPASLILTQKTARDDLRKYFEKQYATSSDRLILASKVAAHFLVPNLVADVERTEANRLDEINKISPVRMIVSKGERIVSKHEKITEDTYLKLISLYNSQQSDSMGKKPLQRFVASMGTLFLALMISFLFGAFLKFSHPETWKSIPGYLTLIVPILLIALTAHILRFLNLTTYAIPILFITVIIASLFSEWLAFLASVVTILLVSVGFKGNAVFISSTLASAAVVSFSLKTVNMRNKMVIPIAYAAATGIICVFVFNFVMFIPINDIMISCTQFGISAFMASLAAMLVLPLAEKFSGRTSDFTLMDASNSNSLLLKKLAVEAPGTFAHSILVGNAAAAAAEAIGANPVLARAGGYYHDIGKLINPEYYEENQTGRNPHDQLSPFESFRILTAHPSEGVELGKLHDLPQSILDIIEQHHGTTLLEFFLRKARNLNPTVIPADFRYSTPKPTTVEAVVVMICDAAEAALRSRLAVQPETESEVREYLLNLIFNKINDGQFSNSPLMLKDIDKIVNALIPIFKGVHHRRIVKDYDFLSAATPPSN